MRESNCFSIIVICNISFEISISNLFIKWPNPPSFTKLLIQVPFNFFNSSDSSLTIHLLIYFYMFLSFFSLLSCFFSSIFSLRYSITYKLYKNLKNESHPSKLSQSIYPSNLTILSYTRGLMGILLKNYQAESVMSSLSSN